MVGRFDETPSSELLGEVSFVFTTNPVHTELAFFKDGVPVGVLLGGGIKV